MRLVLERLQQADHTLTRAELEGVAALAVESCTVSLMEDTLREQFSWLPPDLAREVVALATIVQAHRCGQECTRNPPDGQECSLYFPRPPAHFTMVSRLPDLHGPASRRSFLEPLESLQCRVQALLRELKRTDRLATTSLHSLLCAVDPSAPQHTQDGGLSWAGMTATPGPDLTYLLQRLTGLPGIREEEVLRVVCWHWSLLYRRQPRVILARTVPETYTASFSPAILLCTRSNHEVELITATPSKAFSYAAKGSLSSSNMGIQRVVRELQERGEEEKAAEVESLREQYKLRQVSLPEAIYRLNPALSLSKSNLNICFKSFKYLNNDDNDNLEEEEGDNFEAHNDDSEDDSDKSENGSESQEEEEDFEGDYSWR